MESESKVLERSAGSKIIISNFCHFLKDISVAVVVVVVVRRESLNKATLSRDVYKCNKQH